MSATADRYRSLTAGFTARVESVPPDRWENESPCEGWTARDVVRHAVDTSGMFLGFVGMTLPAAPSVDDDPAAAWTSARAAVQAALDDPAVAAMEYEGFAGRSTFEAGIARFLCPDVLTHTWDLARATGLDERLDPDSVHEAFEASQPMPEFARAPGIFGPEVEPAPDADEQTRFLNYLGRRV